MGDVAALPFPDASFDLVVNTLSLHHWADQQAGRPAPAESRALSSSPPATSSPAPDVVELHSRARATLAAATLGSIVERMPFEVRSISVTGGSEFMAEFDAACEARGIRLFVLPPRSPKLHGGVERANRTHTEEFYECSTAEPTVAALGAALRDWETTYNAVRPHQALGYLTPAEYLASLGVDV